MVFCRDGWRCVYCGLEPTKLEVRKTNKPFRINIIPIDAKNREFEVDHFIAYTETKDNSFYNLVTSCWECNSKKSNRKWNKPCIRRLSL